MHAPCCSRPALLPLLVACVALLTSGCMDYEGVVKLNADGTGTYEETVLFSEGAVEMLKMMASGGEEGEEIDLFPEADFEERAGEMGAGVAFSSFEKLTDGGREGYRTVYAFDDINTLLLNQNPSENLPGDLGGQSVEEDEVPEVITFAFMPGSPASLVIYLPGEESFTPPDTTEEEETVEADSAQAEMELQMMREMLDGSRLVLVLEINGTLIETDAAHRDGNRLTLFAIDFDEMMSDSEAFSQAVKTKPQTYEEAMEMMKTTPGVQVELKDSVSVRFE